MGMFTGIDKAPMLEVEPQPVAAPDLPPDLQPDLPRWRRALNEKRGRRWPPASAAAQAAEQHGDLLSGAEAKRLRETLGVNQRVIAALANLSPHVLSNWERGAVSLSLTRRYCLWLILRELERTYDALDLRIQAELGFEHSDAHPQISRSSADQQVDQAHGQARARSSRSGAARSSRVSQRGGRTR